VSDMEEHMINLRMAVDQQKHHVDQDAETKYNDIETSTSSVIVYRCFLRVLVCRKH